jgi:hypothetical protein
MQSLMASKVEPGEISSFEHHICISLYENCFYSALAAIRAILDAAQSMLEAEAGGRWKMVTFIGGPDGVGSAEVLP